jgi:hypothetical protein
MHRPTVLILASDPGFSREITASWPQDSAPHCNAPEFIVLDEGFSRDLEGSHYDLAIADASSFEKNLSHHHDHNHTHDDRNQGNNNDNGEDQRKRLTQALKQSLAGAGKPAIIVRSSVHSDPLRGFYEIDGAVLELRREPGLWPVVTGLIGREILCRARAELRAVEAEKVCAGAQDEATLGRYMVEMRTNVNNALTTVLGNAELLVIEPGLPATVLAQADTIRNMALRLHEVFQRFSSIEKELRADARESGKKAAHAAAGR